MGSFDSVVGFLLQVLLSSLTNSPTDMKSFVSVIGLIGAAAAAPQYLADTPEVAAAKVEFKAAFDLAASKADMLDGAPAAEPYVHVDVPAELYVHDEPALEAAAEVAAEPYVHVEVPAEPYVHVEPAVEVAAEPVVAPAIVPAPLKLAPAPAPVAPAPLKLAGAPVLPAGFYAAHHLAGYPAPLGYYPYALPVPGCFNNKGEAVECLLPKIAAPVAAE